MGLEDIAAVIKQVMTFEVDGSLDEASRGSGDVSKEAEALEKSTSISFEDKG